MPLYRLALAREEAGKPALVRDLSFAAPILVGEYLWVPGDAEEPLEVRHVEHRPAEGRSDVWFADACDVPEEDVPYWLGLGFREEAGM